MVTKSHLPPGAYLNRQKLAFLIRVFGFTGRPAMADALSDYASGQSLNYSKANINQALRRWEQQSVEEIKALSKYNDLIVDFARKRGYSLGDDWSAKHVSVAELEKRLVRPQQRSFPEHLAASDELQSVLLPDKKPTVCFIQRFAFDIDHVLVGEVAYVWLDQTDDDQPIIRYDHYFSCKQMVPDTLAPLETIYVPKEDRRVAHGIITGSDHGTVWLGTNTQYSDVIRRPRLIFTDDKQLNQAANNVFFGFMLSQQKYKGYNPAVTNVVIENRKRDPDWVFTHDELERDAFLDAHMCMTRVPMDGPDDVQMKAIKVREGYEDDIPVYWEGLRGFQSMGRMYVGAAHLDGQLQALRRNRSRTP